MVQHASQLPTWLTSGSWKPTSLSALENLKGNIISLCFLVTFVSAFIFGKDMSALHLLVAPFLDFAQRRLSWSLNTKPEQIYLALVTDRREHVFRNTLELARQNKPVLVYSLLAGAVTGPALWLHLYEPELPMAFVPYCTAYLVLLSASFAFFAHPGNANPSSETDVDPHTYARYSGSLGGENLPYESKKSLFIAYPAMLVIWIFSASQYGYSEGHLAGIVLCMMIIMRTDQDIYNGKVVWLAESLKKNS